MNKTKETANITTVKKGLKARDIATIGIFSAVLFAICVASSAIVGLVPTIYAYAPAIMSLLAAPIFMLIVSKVHKIGAILLPCTIVGLLFLVMGAPVILVFMLVAGLLGELIASKSKYQNFKLISVSYLLYVVAYYVGTIAPMYFMLDAYTKQGTELFDEAYIQSLLAVAYTPVAYVAIPVTIVVALLGAHIGKKMMKKHFEKAGIV